MIEAEALAWLAAHGWSQEGREVARLATLAALITVENDQQNLVAASTLPHIWARHIVDSAQLLPLTRGRDGLWVDLGSGAGFPGLVIACLREEPILLVETRGLRARFLQRCTEALELSHVEIQQAKVERADVPAAASIISARAFAPLAKTFALAKHLSDQNTLWVLPKGQSAHLELETAQREWQAVFHVEQSVTDPDSAIVVASDVRPRSMSRSTSARSRTA